MIQLDPIGDPKGDPKGYPKGYPKEDPKGNPKKVYGAKKEKPLWDGEILLMNSVMLLPETYYYLESLWEC